MAEKYPYVQQNRSVEAGTGHNAQEWRWMTAALGPPGVAGPTDCKVSPGGTMNVSVARGGALIPDGASPTPGLYHAFNDAAVVRPVDPASTTLNRMDRIVYQVLDTAFGDVEDRAKIAVIRGNPVSGTAVAPPLPRGALSLGVVAVPANLANGTITAAQLADYRKPGGAFAAPQGMVWSARIDTLPGAQRQSTGVTTWTLANEVLPTLDTGRRYAWKFVGVLIFSAGDGGGDFQIHLGQPAVFWGTVFQGRAAGVAGNSFAINGTSQTWTPTVASPNYVSLRLLRSVGSGALTIEGTFGQSWLELHDVGGAIQ